MLQSGNDIIPFRRAGLQSLAVLLPATADIALICVPVVIPVLVIRLSVRSIFCFVSFDLTADGRWIPFKDFSDFSKRITFG